jgi:hypothetical protein
MGSCAAPSAKGDDKFITTDYLQQCRARTRRFRREIACHPLVDFAASLINRISPADF